MTEPAWHSLAHLPAGTVHGIRWRWECYDVAGAASSDKQGFRTYYEVRNRELVALTATPEAWRPEDPVRFWGQRLPPPALAATVTPRKSHEQLAFDAAAAAAEMEEWRERARAHHRKGPADSERGDVQWWRDVTKVEYAPQGAVTLEMCEARVMRHLILEQSLPFDLKRQLSNAAALANFKMVLPADYESCPKCDGVGRMPDSRRCGKCRGLGAVASARSDWAPPLSAEPEDWRDFEIVTRWCVEAKVRGREFVVLRSRMTTPPATWQQIADELGVKYQRVQRIYKGVIERLVAAANAEAVVAPMALAALQERNRAARRGA